MAKRINIAVDVDSIGTRQCSINIGGQQLLINGDALYVAIERGCDPTTDYDRNVETSVVLEELSQ